MTQNELIGYMVGYMRKTAEKDDIRVDGTEGDEAIQEDIEAADQKDQTQGSDKSMSRVGFSGGQPRSYKLPKLAHEDDPDLYDSDDDDKDKKKQDAPQPPPTVGSQWQDSVTDTNNL